MFFCIADADDKLFTIDVLLKLKAGTVLIVVF
jgi:hypothetical protein